MSYYQQRVQPTGEPKEYQPTGFAGEPNFDVQQAEQLLFPIASLTESHESRWFVKARVVEKAPIKKWSNQRGNGYLASFTIVDNTQTAIRATMFNSAVDKFYEMLKPGQVFYFGNGRIKAASKRFTSLAHDYELTFDQNSSIQPIAQDDGAIPMQSLANFISLRDLPDQEVGRSIDVKAVITEVPPVVVINRKAGGELRKRTLKVADNTTTQTYDFTLWEDAADQFNGEVGMTVVSRNCRINKFQDALNLSAGSVELNTAEANDLKSWWLSGGSSTNFTHASSGSAGVGRNITRVGLDVVESQGLGRGEGYGDKIHIRGCVTVISDKNMFYPACPMKKDEHGPADRLCNKKVTLVGEEGSEYRCPIGHGQVEPAYRYITSMKVGDPTNHVFVTAFDEQAQKLFGRPAKDFAHPPPPLDGDSIMQDAKKRVEWRPCTMTLRVKEEIDKETNSARMKYAMNFAHVLSTPKDFVHDSNALLREIERYHTEKVK